MLSNLFAALTLPILAFGALGPMAGEWLARRRRRHRRLHLQLLPRRNARTAEMLA